MRALCTLSLIATLVLVPSPSRAEERAPSVAFLTGASIFFAGFVVGGVLAATGTGNDSQENAGWLTMESGFALAPLASHATAGEWGRALVFTAPPAAVLAASATLLEIHPATIEHGELADQRVIWSFFGVGVLSGLVGVVDAAFADKRARGDTPATSWSKLLVAVQPVLGSGQVGLRLRGSL